MALGKRIAQRLSELNWKRKDLLAAVPELTPQALSNLIRRDSARSEWDMDIARALRVSVLWLVYGHDGNLAQVTYDDAAGPVTVLPSKEPDAIDRLVTIARRLPPEAQFILLGRAEELADRYPPVAANRSA